jgi:hypothetical protein
VNSKAVCPEKSRPETWAAQQAKIYQADDESRTNGAKIRIASLFCGFVAELTVRFFDGRIGSRR